MRSSWENKDDSLRRYREAMTRLAVACTISTCVVLVTILLNVGHWLSAPRSMPTKGDLIVVLGGAGFERVQTAFHLYREGHAKRILINGVKNGLEERGNYYLHWESRFFLDRGVPAEALVFDDRSRNSYEEANNAVLLMKDHEWKTVLVISDPPHLRRLDMVWGPACARHGLEYRLIATNPSTWDASGWWHDRRWAEFVGMELLKLPYYVLAH